MKIILNVIFFICILVPSVSFADGFNVIEMPGGTVAPIKNETIQMLSENVEITPTEGDDYPMKVVCRFIFKNQADKKLGIDMGFPIYNNWLIQDEYGMHKKAMVFNAVLVNGEKAAFTEKKVNRDIKLGSEYRGVYAWKVDFNPMEKKTVEIEYIMEWGYYWRGYEPLTIDRFKYITKTGALWKGAIAQADFYLSIPEQIAKVPKIFWENPKKPPKLYWNINPKGKMADKKKIEWHFRNWKPQEDIVVELYKYEPFYDNDPRLSEMIKMIMSEKKTYEGQTKIYAKKDILVDLPSYKRYGKKFPFLVRDNKKYQVVLIKALKNEIYARHGKIFKDEYISNLFGYSDWYKPNSKYSDSLLNNIEKKNILFLERLERQRD